MRSRGCATSVDSRPAIRPEIVSTITGGIPFWDVLLIRCVVLISPSFSFPLTRSHSVVQRTWQTCARSCDNVVGSEDVVVRGIVVVEGDIFFPECVLAYEPPNDITAWAIRHHALSLSEKKLQLTKRWMFYFFFPRNTCFYRSKTKKRH